jgi:hypothetical protein
MRGPRRGEGRLTTRMTVAEGVSSLKRGRNSYGGSNSNGSGGSFWRGRGREAGGEEVGCPWCSRKQKGGVEEGGGDDGAAPI